MSNSSQHAGGTGSAADVLCPVREFLEGMPQLSLRDFLDDWPASNVTVHCFESNDLPVVSWMPAAVDNALPETARMMECLASAAGDLCWRQTYAADDFGEDFLNRYGWCEFVGMRGLVKSQRLACGVLMLAPHTTYPAHRHVDEEIYIPISGAARWWRRGDSWKAVEPGTPIHHPSGISHAVKTDTAPLAALYLWREGDLTQKSLIC